MSRAQKIVLGIAAGVLILLFGLTFAGAAAVYEAGSIAVHVHEKHGNRTSIHLWIPAVFVHAGLMVVPDVQWQKARHDDCRELRKWWPIVESSLAGLSRCPDGEYVLVESDEENVRVAKIGGAVIVDVETPDESVHLSVPLGVVKSVARHLAPLAGAA